ncbi:MAG: pilus assembly protein PilZ [Desulfuromonas sp.]|nr:MAG: pilus assembly protein PilZ [Desulfuromonas sp.]
MNEKRHYARVDFVEQAQLHLAGQAITVTLHDISLKGALIELPQATTTVVEATPCQLSLCLANSEIILAFDAQVVHIHEKTIGMTFTGMDSDSMTHLRRLLELNTGNPEEIDRELTYMIQH